MVSPCIDFGDQIRKTFGLATWTVFRSAVAKAGIYDENFFPGYFEDDEIVWRYFLAGFKVLAYSDVVFVHGRGKGYETGTSLEDKNGHFSSEVSRSKNEMYYKSKWGPSASSISYVGLTDLYREKIFANCLKNETMKDPQMNLYCSPFDTGQSLSYWYYEPKYRQCVQHATTPPVDCAKVLPHKYNMISNEFHLYDQSYAHGMKRITELRKRVFADKSWIAGLGYGTTNQGMLWDLYEPLYNCHNRQRLGRAGDGGKWVCNIDRLSEPCVVYSFGSNGEISFEQDLLIEAPHCQVHIFDPLMDDPEVLKHNKYFNGPDAIDLFANRTIPNVHWHSFGLSDKKDTLKTERFGKINVMTLTQIMEYNHHNYIDLLKVDIEGFEWPAFLNSIFLMKTLPFGQFLIEVHEIDSPTLIKFLETAESLGLRMFSKDPVQYGTCNPLCHNVELSYVNVMITPRIY